MQADGAAYMARDKKVQQEVHFFICLKIFMGANRSSVVRVIFIDKQQMTNQLKYLTMLS